MDGVIEPVHGVRFGNEERADLTDRVAEVNAFKFKRSAHQFGELFCRLFRHGGRQRDRHAVDEFIRGAGERKSNAQLRIPAHRIGEGAETHNQIFGVDIGVKRRTCEGHQDTLEAYDVIELTNRIVEKVGFGDGITQPASAAAGNEGGKFCAPRRSENHVV